MFKKTKKLNPAPKPITVDQILSDLQTFAVPKQERSPTRYLSQNDPEFDQQWWKLFETFVDDVEQLQRLQKTLETTKEGLVEKRADVQQLIDLLERDMATEVKVIEDIPLSS